jgi:hypothetical protein
VSDVPTAVTVDASVSVSVRVSVSLLDGVEHVFELVGGVVEVEDAALVATADITDSSEVECGADSAVLAGVKPRLCDIDADPLVASNALLLAVEDADAVLCTAQAQ